MNAEYDHILLNMTIGRNRIFIEDLEAIDWPPPERIFMEEGLGLREATEEDDVQFVFKRISLSQLTDEQIKKCPGVARGAEYKYENEIE